MMTIGNWKRSIGEPRGRFESAQCRAAGGPGRGSRPCMFEPDAYTRERGRRQAAGMSGWSANWWWVAAGIAVAAELGTGTFYLLMIALGLAAGAVAAQLGSAPAYQLLAAAAIGGGATALWHWRRISRPPSG